MNRADRPPSGAVPRAFRIRAQTLLLAAVSAVGVAVSLQFLVALTRATLEGPDRHSDFLTYYTSATLLRRGESPYDQAAQVAARSHLLATQPEGNAILFFFLPPPFLLPIIPLTLLPPWTANLLWTCAQVLVAWPLCAVLLGALSSRWQAVVILSWLGAWLPVVVNFRFGQISFFLLLGFLGLTHALRRQRQVAAGLWLSLLWVKPALLLVPVVLLLYLRWWRALAVALASFVLSLAVTLVVFGPGLLPDYLHALHGAAVLQAGDELWRLSTYSLVALARRCGYLEWPALLLLDLAVLSIWRQILRRRGVFDAACTSCVVGLLMSPHVLVYDLVACVAVAPAIVRRPSRLSVPLLAGGFFLTWSAHITLDEPAYVVLWLILILVLVRCVRPDERQHQQAALGG